MIVNRQAAILAGVLTALSFAGAMWIFTQVTDGARISAMAKSQNDVSTRP